MNERAAVAVDDDLTVLLVAVYHTSSSRRESSSRSAIAAQRVATRPQRPTLIRVANLFFALRSCRGPLIQSLQRHTFLRAGTYVCLIRKVMFRRRIESHLLASSESGTALTLRGRLAASRRYFATGYAVVPSQYQRNRRPRSPAEAPPSSRPM